MSSKYWKDGRYSSEYLLLGAFLPSICWTGTKEEQGYQGSFNNWRSKLFQSAEDAKIATEEQVRKQLTVALARLNEEEN